MVIDFQKIDFKEKPILILKNLDGEPIQTLGFAFNITAEFAYNEVSTLSFELPSHVDGMTTPHYDDVIGMRLIDLKDYGLFILVDPKEESDGVRRVKSCTAYSLEYEFTKKKITIENGTYNFWNTYAPQDTIMGIILEEMPEWRVVVDSSLIGKYRTFEVTEENIYDFMKNTLQESYGCIFNFDTYNRVIHVTATAGASDDEEPKSVYLSSERLIKKIEIEEDSDTIVTCLDVNGAEGVTIRSINPTGTNKIYNLDYFMNTTNFPQELIDKWREWELACESQAELYFNITMEYNLQIAKRLASEASLTTLKGELTALENIQAVTIQAIAQGLNKTQKDLNAVNADIAAKQNEIANKEAAISITKEREAELLTSLADINKGLDMDAYFTETELKSLRRYFIEDSLEDETFVAATAASYNNEDVGKMCAYGDLDIYGATVEQISASDTKTMYSIVGGWLNLLSRKTEEVENYFQPEPPSKAKEGAYWYASGTGTVSGEVYRFPTQADVDNQTPTSAVEFLGEFFYNKDIPCTVDEDVTTGYPHLYSTSDGRFFYNDTEIYNNGNFAFAEEYEAGHNVGSMWDVLWQNTTITSVSTTNPFYGGFKIAFEDSFESGKTYIHSNEHGWSLVGDGLLFDISSNTNITAEVVRGTVEFNTDNTFVFTAKLDDGIIDKKAFASANMSFTGEYSNVQSDSSYIYYSFTESDLYFTENTTDYEQHLVEKDLYDYGAQVLSEKSQPTYSFNVDSGNFLSIDDFVSFKNSLALGKKIYLKIDEKDPIQPYVIGLKIEFEKMGALSLEFSNQYQSSDRAFKLAKLLEQSVSMGKKLNIKSNVYSEFVNSGANTSVKAFMNSALDVAKNAVLSSGNQAIEIGDAGIRVRKWQDEAKTTFEDEQIWIVDNMIAFTDDNWATAKMAIGKFKDANIGDDYVYGIVAEHIVGTILAGNNLVIESEKKDGDVAVFRVDGNGAALHNAELQVLNDQVQIVLNPDIGFAIGENPVYAVSTDGKKINEDNAKFWVDTDGNVHMKGTLHGVDGTFSGELEAAGGTFHGELVAASGTFSGVVQTSDFLDASGNSLMTDDKEQLAAKFLSLYGLEIINEVTKEVSFSIDTSGNTTVGGVFKTYRKDEDNNILQVVIDGDGITTQYTTSSGNVVKNGLVVHPSATVNYDTGLSFYSQGEELFEVSRYGDDTVLRFRPVNYVGDTFCGELRAQRDGTMWVRGVWDFNGATVKNLPVSTTATFA